MWKTPYQDLFGGAAQARNYSPLANPRPLAAPVYLAAGTADETIPIESIRAFAAAMRAVGNRVTLWECDGGDHMFCCGAGEPAELTQALVRASLRCQGWIS
jgi:pimeloyl-ACP methyl ester carboxylesterase